MNEIRSSESKILKLLNGQRKIGQFCDVTLKLSNDFQVWAHFCVLAPQSDFVGDKYFLQKDMQFSIHNPLKIEIFNFSCEECLCDLMDFVYCEETTIDSGLVFGEHEEHIKHLCKMLRLKGVLKILLKNKDENNVEECKDSIRLEVQNKQQKKSTTFQYKIKTKPALSKMNSCHGCAFKCYRPSEMLMHLNACTTNNTKCSLCDHTFDTLSEFKGHLIRHDNDKPFFCTDCDQRFGTKTSLKLHIPKHSTEALHMCPVCGKGFKWKHGLDNHMIVHSAEKKLLCDECGYSTSHLKALRTHQLSHTGFSFKCTAKNCSYTSRRKENLKLHIATHKNELPFVCEICGRRFSQSKNLKRHSLIHISKNNLKCPHCSFTNYRTDKLKQHIANQHTEKPLQLELSEEVQSELKEFEPDGVFDNGKHDHDNYDNKEKKPKQLNNTAEKKSSEGKGRKPRNVSLMRPITNRPIAPKLPDEIIMMGLESLNGNILFL